MGMSAEIIAIGPYSKTIASSMDYGPELYVSTKEGAIVTRRLFGISEGSTVSREFAALLGITDAWDFSQHKIDPAKVNIPGLRAFAELYTEYDEEVEILNTLLNAGFDIHFRPQG